MNVDEKKYYIDIPDIPRYPYGIHVLLTAVMSLISVHIKMPSLGDIFISIILPSMTGALLAGLITAIKPFTKKRFGYSWHYYIWLVVLLVMLLPVRIHIPQSRSMDSAARIVRQTELPSDDVIRQTEQAPPQRTDKAGFSGLSISARQRWWLGIIWLSGAAAMLFMQIAGYIRLLTLLQDNSEKKDCPEIRAYTNRKVKMLVCDKVSSPFTFGLTRPTLVLPDRELSAEQLANILRHEMTHLRRGDIYYKWLTVAVKCLHWFNPAVYYISRQINAECEISCDMSVVSNMSDSEQNGYISTIISLLPVESSKNASLTTGMAGSKKVLKKRFAAIKNKRATSKVMSALSAVTAVFLLSASVLAGGALAGEVFSVRVFLGGSAVKLENRPFIENNTVYLPLKELLELEGVDDITVNDKILCEPVMRDGIVYAPYDLFHKLSERKGVFEDLTVSVVSGADSLAGVLYTNSEANFSIELPLSVCAGYEVYEEPEYVTFKRDSEILFSVSWYDYEIVSYKLISEEQTTDVRHEYHINVPDDTALTAQESRFIKDSFLRRLSAK